MQGGVAGFGFPLPKDSVSPPLLCVVTSETAESGPLRSPIHLQHLLHLCIWPCTGFSALSARAPASVRSCDAFHRCRCMSASTTVILYIVHRQAILTLHTSSVCSKTLPARVKDRRGLVGRVSCPTAASEGTELKIKIDHSRISVLILYLSFLSCPFSA